MHKRVKGSQEGGSTKVLWHIERCGENLIFRLCAEQRGYGSQSKFNDTWKLLWMVLYSKFSSVEIMVRSLHVAAAIVLLCPVLCASTPVLSNSGNNFSFIQGKVVTQKDLCIVHVDRRDMLSYVRDCPAKTNVGQKWHQFIYIALVFGC